MLAGQLDRRCEHLLADDAELHRHEDPAEVRHVLEVLLVRRHDALGQALAVRTADGDEDDEADGEPRRAGVSRPRVGRDRDDPDGEGEEGADDRGHRDLGAADVDVERRPVGTR